MPSSSADQLTDAGLLRGLDRAALAVSLCSRLRTAGVGVSTANMAIFTQALGVGDALGRSGLYWRARICLIHRSADIPVLDAVFRAVFEQARLEVDPHTRRGGAPTSAADGACSAAARGGGEQLVGGGLPWASLPRVTDVAEAAAAALSVPQRLPSELAGLADTPFEDLDAQQLERLGAWFQQALRQWPTQRTRRIEHRARGGYVDLRATLSRARRTAWEPIHLVRGAPRSRRRRLVMVCDVSQSMQAHSTAYLHLMRAAVIAADAEVFAFATGLTRLTALLTHRSAEVAIEQATAAVTDRFGGTRIATNLRALLRSRHGGLLRGAIVLVASDGWDTDDPASLGSVMGRLKRRADRVIWMNPRVSAEGFAPLVGAMAAALPHCDELVPAHDLRALAEAIGVVDRTGRTSSIRLRGLTGGRPPARFGSAAQ